MKPTLLFLSPFLLTGCLDLGPRPAPAVRWLSAETAAAEPAAPRAPGVELFSIRAATHLDQRVTWRRQEVEYGFFESLRWTEPPAEYLRRALVHELHLRRGWLPTGAAEDLRLDAQLVAFEEDWSGGERRARVRLEAELQTPEGLRLRVIDLVEPIAGDDPLEIARALRGALERAAAVLGDWIE